MLVAEMIIDEFIVLRIWVLKVIRFIGRDLLIFFLGEMNCVLEMN